MFDMPLTRETIERTDGSLALVAGPYRDATYGEDTYEELAVCLPGDTCYWISDAEQQWLSEMLFDGDDPDDAMACHWDPVWGSGYVPF